MEPDGRFIPKRSKNNPTTMEPDWSLLLPDLLQAISEKVLVIADYIRFRAVCHPWRSASSPRPHHLPVQAPWLMLPSQYSKGNDDDSSSTHLFYDISTTKTHILDLPYNNDVQICGCSHGWLVVHDYKLTTSLHNPITHTTIFLPSYTTKPRYLFTTADQAIDRDHFFQKWDQIDCFRILKAILTSSPLNPNSLVFVFIYELSCIAFCKIGDKRWTVLIEIMVCDISDFTYSNGFLYTVDHFANITIFNLDSSSRRQLVGHGSDPYANYVVVEGVFGDILLIEITEGGGGYNEHGLFVNGNRHSVYKISNNEEPEWIEVTDLGQNMLFVNGYRHNRHAISLSSVDHPQLQKWGANCFFLYSERLLEWFDHGYELKIHNIELVKLDEGTVSDISGELGMFEMAIYVQINSFWLTPSLF